MTIPSLPDSLHTVIIDPKGYCEIRALELMSRCSEFTVISTFSSVAQAELHLQKNESIDLAFIADDVDHSEMQSFIDRARKSYAGQDTFFVLLVRGMLNRYELANRVLSGVDSLLVLPSSQDALRDLIQHILPRREHLKSERVERALGLYLDQLREQLRIRRKRISSGGKGNISKTVLENMSATLLHLDKDMRDSYFFHLVDYFIEIPAPAGEILEFELSEFHATGTEG